jgi:hypothetical protein
VSHPERLQHGRALGYLGRSPSEDALRIEVEALRSGCAALGLTLVGVIQEPGLPVDEADRATLADHLEPYEINCVALTRVDADIDLRGFLTGVPVVVVGTVPERPHG